MSQKGNSHEKSKVAMMSIFRTMNLDTSFSVRFFPFFRFLIGSTSLIGSKKGSHLHFVMSLHDGI